MENKKKTIFNVIFLLVVFAGTMYGVFHGEDIGEIVKILGQVNVLYEKRKDTNTGFDAGADDRYDHL